jgi:hypothetical protein
MDGERLDVLSDANLHSHLGITCKAKICELSIYALNI